MQPFAKKLIAWQKKAGRSGLPWQLTRDPYLRWVSEIMLQQTQVSTVIPYYEAFARDFPTVSALAAASEEEVLAHWAGLGYYSRARNLHAAAKQVARAGGEMPCTLEGLAALPGIGRSTAAAVLSACWDMPEPILDGNAKRVFSRFFGVKRGASEARFLKELWAIAEREEPRTECGCYAQALMDLGAGLCSRSSPRCAECPLEKDCAAARSGDPGAWPGKPAAKKKERRCETADFIVFLREGRAWLARRGGDAVWKGLWCFPEYAGNLPEEEFRAALARDFGTAPAAPRLRFEAKHDFTHYRLQMRVWSAQAAEDPKGEGRWFSAEEAKRGALPAPILEAALRLLGGEA